MTTHGPGPAQPPHQFSRVPAPMFISTRLMAAHTIPDAGTVHLISQGRDPDDDNRIRYQWVIEDADGREVGTGCDLASGAGAPVDYLAAAASLLAFLEYAVETTSPDALFSAAVTEWARQHSDEITMARLQIDTHPGNHPEECVSCNQGNTEPHLPQIT